MRTGREISFGNDFRIAPLGNRTGKIGELPHINHRRPGISNHRPWEGGW
jgi:hypothetical protein